MECECVSKHKSMLLILMIIHSLMVWQIHGVCIEEERKALLEIKASLIHSYDVDPSVTTWVDDGGECCDWERVTCNTTTRHVTDLSLSNIIGMKYYDCQRINWPLNISVFLHFKELTSLNLSKNCLHDGILNTGFERLSSLKKLEILDLRENRIGNDIFPSLGGLTSLRVLHLGFNNLEGSFPALALENLEILDLSNYFYNTFRMKGFERISLFKKLKILNLGGNNFNESGFITSLSALPLLKSLDLSSNSLYGSFPAEELAHLTDLEELDLSHNRFNDTPSIQDCARLSGLKKLKSMTLAYNNFNKSVISCLSALPSLKGLDISGSLLGGSFPIQELSGLKELETLELDSCGLEFLTFNEMSHIPDLKLKALHLRGNSFNGTLPMEALASFHHLEVLDLSSNNFVGSIPSTIHALSSLRGVSFAYNSLNGSLLDHGLCELKNLHWLDLCGNKFGGNLPQCFNNLSSLKLLDVSSNQFTGTLLPSLIVNLKSLEYIDFSENKMEGSFLFSSLSNHTNLKVFISKNNKLEVDTEEPIGWISMFQLEVLVLSSCNLNTRVVPRFLLHQRKLLELDLSHNSLVGQFPCRLIENNTMLKVLNLRNNSFGGTICNGNMANIRWWDMSGNHMNGTIPGDIRKFLPNVGYLNLSSNSLDGVIPSSLGDLRYLWALDLSNNEFSGEVPKGLFSNLYPLDTLKLSKNKLHGQVLSGNTSFCVVSWLALDSNRFTGKIGNGTCNWLPFHLDISNNLFTGTVPHWISNMSDQSKLVIRNNRLEGQFPCGKTPFSFLDISKNYFSGPIPSCLNLTYMKHLHLGFNRLTGSIPDVFRNLTNILTLDLGNNNLSGRIPQFLGKLSNLRILILRKNNFTGSIPKQLCRLSNVSLIDLSSNSLSGSIPCCLQNIKIPIDLAFTKRLSSTSRGDSFYHYVGELTHENIFWLQMFEIEDEVQFTTKALSLAYKGSILDYMAGMDLSDNKLTGEIPNELGLLTKIHSLNLSHNQLSGPIPVNFSNLANIESLDLSSNRLNGEIPSQLIKLTSLAVFNVSHNNLSGRLPETKAQFGTFTKESYEGNPLLCGLPLEKKCTPTSPVTDPSTKEGAKDGGDKWYDVDMTSFYGSSGSTWVVFLLGLAAVLYINPYWRRRWLDFVEECMYTCYYFLEDFVCKVTMVFRK